MVCRLLNRSRTAKHYLESYNQDQPWFCWVSFGGPHEPWDAPEPYASRYDPNTMPEPIVDGADEPPRPEGYLDYARKNRHWHPTFEEGDIGAMRANYAGNVSLIDDQIGEVLAVIEARGEMDNTLIAFTSDHGEMNGDHGLIYKMNFYDSALRVPLIIKSPGEDGGNVNDSLVENCDVGPTLVELAGGTIEYRQFARSLTGAMAGGRHREDGLSEFMGEFMLINDVPSPRFCKSLTIRKHGRTTRDNEGQCVIGGFMRFEADSIEDIKALLPDNPAFLSGNEIEISELIKT